MNYFALLGILLLTTVDSFAQHKSSVSLGGGITYPAANNYDLSWFGSVHWNVRIASKTFVDTHITLAEIGVDDYPDAIGV